MKSIDEMLDAVAKNLNQAPSSLHTQQKSETTPSPMYNAITLSFAKELAYAVETAAKQLGINVVTAVVDSGANLILLQAMDNSYIASVRAAQDKAYTAAALKMPTYEALSQSRGGALDGLTNGNGILLLGGGEPFIKDGKLLGAIGVSGGTKEQDILLAKLGQRYFRTRIK